MTLSPAQQNGQDRMVTSHVFEFHQSKKKSFSLVKVSDEIFHAVIWNNTFSNFSCMFLNPPKNVQFEF